MTILEFAKLICRLVETPPEVVFKDLPVDDPKTRQPDISKARRCLDWEPRVDLETGLKTTIDFFKDRV